MFRSSTRGYPLRWLLAGVLAVSILAATERQPDTAEAAENSPIAAAALRHLNTHGGQCWTFMQQVVAEATGRQVGSEYRQGYFQAGAVEVSAAEATNGDIIQIASDANTSAWASYPGLHTAIILENLGGGVFNAVDSNQNWDEWVRLRPNYNPYAAAARYGLQVHIYRIPGGSGAAAAAPEVSATFGAGDTATVATGTDCLNLRGAASLAGGRMGCLPGGTAVTVTGASVAANGFVWAPVSTPLGSGWVAANYLTKTGSAAPPPAVAAEQPAPAAEESAPSLEDPGLAPAAQTSHVDNSPGCLRVRVAAGLGANIKDCLDAGTQVVLLEKATIVRDGYTWTAIRSPGFVEGWVAGEYLDP